ncbi:Deoxyribose-phosphate aldolase [Syntrophobotulus glycolicus DSM 8271]|uniref:Deoxyribose-phosphate aldolase n=1 Tax=Syntrophobotulus glycolicus (strain DSM 8271 / FlGlyR) TaxID=645991 RepID=F0SVD2_SYNGF|nr:deoxyribose-phosphate aldolase [Syntrophobotulus glycolicus]ADY56705.1 Deoxyribose-phosphate aldolase [Syntrophobotulus glycolicus DSM 8271]
MNLGGKIDHTLLKPDASEKDIVSLCHEAVKHHFVGVCVNPSYICTAARLLHGTNIIPVTVVGFPLGAVLTETKVQEILVAKAFGAREVDVVMNIGMAKSRQWDELSRDINRTVEAAHACGLGIKIIIETGLLNQEEKKKAAEIVRDSGADFIKTSTGFFGGATAEDVRSLRKWAGPLVKIKASGGIKTREAALELLEAGADRLGTSSGLAIVTVDQ